MQPQQSRRNSAVLVCTATGDDRDSTPRSQVVGHSLTSNSAVSDWWPELLGDGEGFSLDTQADFVVCANYICSPYGTALALRGAEGPSPTLPSHMGVVTVRMGAWSGARESTSS